MSAVVVDLRVLARTSDGRMVVYCWDGLRSTGELRDHLESAGRAMSDQECYEPEDEFDPSYRAVFSEWQP